MPYAFFMLYYSIRKREKIKVMKSKLNGYWVNKKSGTIHSVFTDTDTFGKLKLINSTLNLRYERMYFIKHDNIDRFLKNYEFICNKDVDNDFFVNVLANKKLKSDFSYGFISKEEFFNKVKGY